MPSLKLLNGVAHDIAHHAQSGLSWLHPHIGQACRIAGATAAEVELLDEAPYPTDLPRLEPLVLALQGLQGKLFAILDSHRLDHAAVQSVRIQFVFKPNCLDDYLWAVVSRITSSTGRVFEKRVL